MVAIVAIIFESKEMAGDVKEYKTTMWIYGKCSVFKSEQMLWVAYLLWQEEALHGAYWDIANFKALRGGVVLLP